MIRARWLKHVMQKNKVWDTWGFGWFAKKVWENKQSIMIIFIPSPLIKNGVFSSHISKSYEFKKLIKIIFSSIFWDASCNIIFYCFNVVLSMKAGRPIYFYPISSEKIRRDDAETTFPIKSIPIVPYLLPLCARKTTILTILPNLLTTTLLDRNTPLEFYKGF